MPLSIARLQPFAGVAFGGISTFTGFRNVHTDVANVVISGVDQLVRSSDGKVSLDHRTDNSMVVTTPDNPTNQPNHFDLAIRRLAQDAGRKAKDLQTHTLRLTQTMVLGNGEQTGNSFVYPKNFTGGTVTDHDHPPDVAPVNTSA